MGCGVAAVVTDGELVSCSDMSSLSRNLPMLLANPSTQRGTLFTAQAGVLMWQYWRGPRCFVPRCFLPPKYDYHRPAPVAILPGGSQCDTPVCAPGQAADGGGSDAAEQQSLVLRSSSSSAFNRHGSSDSDKGESGHSRVVV